MPEKFLRMKIAVAAVMIILIAVINPVGLYARRMIFYPSSQIEAVPSDIGLAFEDVRMKTSDGVDIHGWFVPSSQARGTLLFFHGNAGNISHRLEKIGLFHAMDMNVFIIDYRGYGQSRGIPSEDGMLLDAQAAYDYVLTRKDIDPRRIVIYGESLGGAAAIDLALTQSVAGVISDSTFTSIPDMAKVVVPWFPRFLIQNPLDSLRKISKIRVPKLILHSPDDEMIPFEMGQRLFEAAPEPKTFVTLKGGHNDGFLVDRKVFVSAISQFLETVLL